MSDRLSIMNQDKIPYEVQIFVCTNDAGGQKASCGDQDGLIVFKELRKIAKERGLHPCIRVSQAKCLGQCAQGTSIMIYPQGIWYKNILPKDVPELAEKYLPLK